jgi:hypothetical protein
MRYSAAFVAPVAKSLAWEASDTGWTAADPAVTGTAMELSGTEGLYNVFPTRQVQIHYTGTNSDGDPIYVFAAGSRLPPAKEKGTVLQVIDDVHTFDWDFIKLTS